MPAILMVIMGIVLERQNIDALHSHMDACEARLTCIENTFARFNQKFAAGLDRAR